MGKGGERWDGRRSYLVGALAKKNCGTWICGLPVYPAGSRSAVLTVQPPFNVDYGYNGVNRLSWC